MSKQVQDKHEEKPRVLGEVVTVLPNTEYLVKVKLGGLEHVLKAYPSGKIRKFYIKLQEGDQVIIEIDLLNLDLGRVILRVDKGRTIPEWAKPTLTEELINA